MFIEMWFCVIAQWFIESQNRTSLLIVSETNVKSMILCWLSLFQIDSSHEVSSEKSFTTVVMQRYSDCTLLMICESSQNRWCTLKSFKSIISFLIFWMIHCIACHNWIWDSLLLELYTLMMVMFLVWHSCSAATCWPYVWKDQMWAEIFLLIMKHILNFKSLSLVKLYLCKQ